jgi:hypothetical protein
VSLVVLIQFITFLVYGIAIIKIIHFLKNTVTIWVHVSEMSGVQIKMIRFTFTKSEHFTVTKYNEISVLCDQFLMTQQV